MSQEIVVQQRLEKNELEKSILKIRREEQEEEEEEEEEDYDDSLKAKTTVKFVVEPEDQSKSATKLVIESTSKLSPQIESGLNEFFETKIDIQSLEHYKQDGLLENAILTENHQIIVELLPQSSPSITVAENNIERTVDRVEESVVESKKIVDQQENPEVSKRTVENQVADKILQEAMSKAFQDAAYTQSAGEQPPIQRLQQSPELVEHQHGAMGTFYPTAAPPQPEMRKISSPAQLSPVKVYLHSGAGEQGLGRSEPPSANGHVPRPPWSTTAASAVIPLQMPQQTVLAAVAADPKGAISHQKLADQVAQKAIKNQAQQEQTRQKYKESRGGNDATPESKAQELRHYAPPISTHPQPQEHDHQQQLASNQDFPQAMNYQRAISPKTPSREESLERRMKVTKLHEPASWVVQESVTESQMVKGAPWAKHQVEKKERVWPPPSPKLVQESAEYAPNYEMQRRETEAANPFQQKYPDIYEEQEKKARVPQTSAARTNQHYAESYHQQQQQMRNSPAATQHTVYRENIASPHMPTYEYSQGQEPVVRPTFGYTPQPMQKFVSLSHTQDQTIQKYEPIRPVPFNPQWSPAAARPDLNQPLTLDTTQTAYHQYYHQQQSPRTIYKPQSLYSAADVANVVPPGQHNTSAPVLPFTKAPERQDYERFQSQYSPGRLVYQPERESHRYITNRVASVPGGTSFERVQNVSSVDFDAATGQPYKENVQRIVRTTRTVPKTCQH